MTIDATELNDEVIGPPMSISEVHDLTSEILRECGRIIVGKLDVMRDTLVAFLSNGHVVLEGVPGLAKTYMARTFAAVPAFASSTRTLKSARCICASAG